MLRLVTAAAEEPVTLADAKKHLVVLHDADDTLIAAFITAAREVVEQQTGYALATATYDWTPVGDGRSPLPIEPAQLDSAPDAYPVRFTTTPGPAPAALRAALLLLVGDLYANREAAVEGLTENPAFARLTFPFRRILP
ncbi:hypothetical protein GGR77_001514 [Xanthomonas translucens]